MSIKRYIANKDNTITNAFKSNLSERGTKGNTGASDIVEVFSIFGQASSASVEQSRILIEFPVSEISDDRNSSTIPAKGKVSFIMKLSNATHNQTTPQLYDLCVSPIVRPWQEGIGLDMESYLNEDASNWTKATDTNSWGVTGSDYASYGNIAYSTSPQEVRTFISGTADDLTVDVTDILEDQISYIAGNGTNAHGFVQFKNSIPDGGTILKLTDHQGTTLKFQFSNDSGSVGNTRLVFTGSNVNDSITNLTASINEHFSGALSASLYNTSFLNLSQSSGGYFGNTLVSASDNSQFQSVPAFLSGGAGTPNYGFVVKLSGSYEDGANSQSYYTKKYFSRTSQYFFRRPYIEAQYDDTIKDDRHDIIKSSSLAPSNENLNKIYLYNKRRNGLVDIPSTGSHKFLVQLVPSLGAAPVTASGPDVTVQSPTFITASKHDTGIYEAKFAYAGTESSLIDIWQISSSTDGYINLHTGSAFTVQGSITDSFYETPDYSFNITNLKSTYTPSEKVTLRVYTRDRNYKNNVFTKSTTNAPSNTIRNAYYQISRVADDLVVIPYSTSSAQNYAGLSYDASGSYFNLDMSLFEANYMYEICLLYKDSSNYIEASEKFKFRVDP